MNCVEVKNLSKNYGQLKAVNDVSFSVKTGSIFGLLGPNGAGKTTTIECMIGLRDIDQGSLNILGMDPHKTKEGFFDNVGVQLQETVYQDKIKVKELCLLFQSFYKNSIDYKLLLDRFDLSKRQNSYVTSLSGGEKQKIAITLALMGNPQVLFLDELTTGLDPKSRRSMWEYIKTLKEEGRTILMTTHYMEEAEYLCDYIGIINEGSIIAMGSVAEVLELSEIGIEVTFCTKDDVEQLLRENIKGLYGIYVEEEVKVLIKDESMLNEVIKVLVLNNISFTALNILRPSLEDAYLKLIGKTKEGMIV